MKTLRELAGNRWVRLVKINQKKPNTRGRGPGVYGICAHISWWIDDEKITWCKENIDPLASSQGEGFNTLQWIFKDRKTAEQAFLMFLLRW